MKKKIIRVTTVPVSLGTLLKGQLKFISAYFDVIGVSSSEDGILESIGETEGIKTIPSVEMTRKITPFKDLIALWKLYVIFKKEQPFMVHSHTPKAGTLSMIAAKFAGVPHRLHTIAGLPLVEARGLKRSLLNTVEKVTYACATKIYPNSYGLVDIILDHKFTTPKKLKVIANGSSNGIDTSHFNPAHYSRDFKQNLKAQLQLSENDFIFVYVGRLVKDKGTNELIEAFVKLADNTPNIKLVLVGGYENDLDPLKPNTLDAIKHHTSIVFVPWVKDVRPYFAISNGLVFPSYREGFPNVVLQAGAMGIPSIVTNINGCNEIIIEGQNGLIIPTKDVEALYNKMREFYMEGNKFNADTCRDLIVTRYEQHLVWKAILKEYQGLYIPINPE
ncbi:glycosyltransferase family 4 protein [Tamlana fucoidanivorans]|uniref:Glycosyltransferase family 4 protein n=1 Tax=Allotamlana fucoidanivorans TaxID=2583814 RepID=A0A5C4SS75_9FLAO|nr:glycosyltransferase family 4 protein [Tamlana fucoidanivorans]TNJ46471.1 glycosyltransferase family 4 protein [Tamlana fucoidanivorans]